MPARVSTALSAVVTVSGYAGVRAEIIADRFGLAADAESQQGVAGVRFRPDIGVLGRPDIILAQLVEQGGRVGRGDLVGEVAGDADILGAGILDLAVAVKGDLVDRAGAEAIGAFQG